MEAAAFLSLVLNCAPQVHVDTARALVATESSFNPWAIGVVGGELERQPRSRAQALATAKALQAGGWNFSVGLGQINVGNFSRLGLSLETAFDTCTNLAAMQVVLDDCFSTASKPAANAPSPQHALRKALSCYYSGNFTTGFKHGYVQKVIANAAAPLPRPPAFLKEKT
jgi:type IV secretion system protein VirB1